MADTFLDLVVEEIDVLKAAEKSRDFKLQTFDEFDCMYRKFDTARNQIEKMPRSQLKGHPVRLNLLQNATEVTKKLKILIEHLYEYQLVAAVLVDRQIDRVRLTELALLGMQTVPETERERAPVFGNKPVYLVDQAHERLQRRMGIGKECKSPETVLRSRSRRKQRALGT